MPCRPRVFWSGGTCSRTSRCLDTTSYRTELLGILATLILTASILQKDGTSWENLTGYIYCDNHAAVNQFNKLEGNLPYSIKQANTNDADVLQELRHWKSILPIGIQTKWVKAHQSNLTSRPARLNNVVDKLADTQHSSSPPWAS